MVDLNNIFRGFCATKKRMFFSLSLGISKSMRFVCVFGVVVSGDVVLLGCFSSDLDLERGNFGSIFSGCLFSFFIQCQCIASEGNGSCVPSTVRNC